MRRRDISGHRRWTGGLSVALVSVLAALLAACGGQGGASSGPSPNGPVALTCVAVRSPEGVDVIVTQLTCNVRNAPASDTTFVLRYSVTDPTRALRTYGPTCSGALSNGSGSCSQRYSAPVPLAGGAASVSGQTQPDGHALGPVTPLESISTRTTPGTIPGLISPSPSGAPANGSMVVLTPASAGVTTTLKVGQVAQVQLPDARIWAYAGQTGAGLPGIAPSGVRSAGLYLWTFQAQTTGSATLRFTGKMACESSTPPCLPADITLNFALKIVP